jgi:dTMP kinase
MFSRYRAKSQGIPYEWCRSPDIGLPRPDLIIFLDLDQTTMSSRNGFGKERYEVQTTQSRVREIFKMVQSDQRDSGDWHIIDANCNIDDLHERIYQEVAKSAASGEISFALRRIL